MTTTCILFIVQVSRAEDVVSVTLRVAFKEVTTAGLLHRGNEQTSQWVKFQVDAVYGLHWEACSHGGQRSWQRWGPVPLVKSDNDNTSYITPGVQMVCKSWNCKA